MPIPLSWWTAAACALAVLPLGIAVVRAAFGEWRDRRVQQRADAPTKEFIKYLKAQPLLKAILCGHCHAFWQEPFSPTAMQYVCSATYRGEGYAIGFT